MSVTFNAADQSFAAQGETEKLFANNPELDIA